MFAGCTWRFASILDQVVFRVNDCNPTRGSGIVILLRIPREILYDLYQISLHRMGVVRSFESVKYLCDMLIRYILTSGDYNTMKYHVSNDHSRGEPYL